MCVWGRGVKGKGEVRGTVEVCVKRSGDDQDSGAPSAPQTVAVFESLLPSSPAETQPRPFWPFLAPLLIRTPPPPTRLSGSRWEDAARASNATYSRPLSQLMLLF